jgi:hypothetical protein
MNAIFALSPLRCRVFNTRVQGLTLVRFSSST